MDDCQALRHGRPRHYSLSRGSVGGRALLLTDESSLDSGSSTVDHPPGRPAKPALNRCKIGGRDSGRATRSGRLPPRSGHQSGARALSFTAYIAAPPVPLRVLSADDHAPTRARTFARRLTDGGLVVWAEAADAARAAQQALETNPTSACSTFSCLEVESPQPGRSPPGCQRRRS